MNRLFILREPLHFDSMVAAIRANWQAMAALGKPLGVKVAPYKKTRSTEQNALMWVWLTQISRQAWVGGVQHSPENWHEHCRREFLPETNARGDEKWQELPTMPGRRAERLCVMSTTRLNTEEMGLYMNAIEAFAVADLGVTLQ